MRVAAMAFVLSALPALGAEPPVAGDFLIQLGAERSEAEAAHDWIVVKRRAGIALDGLEPKITPVMLPHKGRLWRLRAGPVDAAGATSICARLKALSIDCIVVH